MKCEVTARIPPLKLKLQFLLTSQSSCLPTMYLFLPSLLPPRWILSRYSLLLLLVALLLCYLNTKIVCVIESILVLYFIFDVKKIKFTRLQISLCFFFYFSSQIQQFHHNYHHSRHHTTTLQEHSVVHGKKYK